MMDGTHQGGRGVPALQKQRFEVDAMALDQRVALVTALAARLNFVDPNNHEAGSWRELFDNDESLVLARLSSAERYRWQTEFRRICDAAPLVAVAHEIVKLARLLDWAYLSLAGSKEPAVTEVHDTIRQLIERQLGGQLDWVLQHFGTQAWNHRPLADVALHLQGPWRGTHAVAQPAPQQSQRAFLRGMFFSFLGAIAQVQGLARAQLPHTLDTQRHEAAPGLLLAFLRLYQTVQAQMNTFSDRHIDFYYQQCLGLLPRAAVADSVHVACQRDARANADPVVPAGASFAAGKDTQDQPLFFRAQQALQVSDARVAALCTLRLQRDALISPEAELNCVTGIKSRWLGLPGPDAPAVPVFGGGPGSEEAALGLVVASPLLLLGQGQRELDVTLRLAWPGQTQLGLCQAALACDSAAALSSALGALFACWMFDADDKLDADSRSLLHTQLRKFIGPCAPLHLLCQPPGKDDVPRDVAFFKYAGGLFDVSLSHAEGWLVPERIQVRRPPLGGAGLSLKIFLRPEDPPITACDAAVHGSQWPTRLPLLRLQASPRAPLHPFSLLEAAELKAVDLKVQVSGVRDLVMHNNLGPLDASKAFAPFGPLPTTSSYLVFGSPEAARKNLDTLSLRLRWGGLPHAAGGFGAHYEAYGVEQSQGLFTAALAILRDGQWQACGGASAHQELFAPPDPEGHLVAEQQFGVDPASVLQNARASAVPLEIGPGVRDGLLRLQLHYPPSAFGHADYAPLLSGALTQRARARLGRRDKTPLPSAPYTPLLEEMSLDYSARTTLKPSHESQAGNTANTGDAPDSERLLHIHPFGVAELRPDASARFHGPLPKLGPDGNLCIGIEASSLEGPLTLLLQLRQDRAAERLPGTAAQPVQWFYLSHNRWRELPPRQVLSDTSGGFLGSGIVTLDLPAQPRGPRKDNTVLPAGLFWLRAASSLALDSAAPLVTVHAQALTLTREVDGTAAASPAQPLAANQISQPQDKLAGLSAVLQPESSSGLRGAEDKDQMRVRAGERLRHKNRASLAWDVERLVLEQFPEVFKVKCFNRQELGAFGTGEAGQVLVAVVPQVRRNQIEDSTLTPRLNTLALQRIHDFVAARASPFTRFTVRNASFERVQVRCTVQPAPHMQPGAVLRRVNRALVEYLSPWFDEGCEPRFGWTLRCDDVQAQVRRVAGVAAVGPLSLLHIVHHDGGAYRLGDTAAQTAHGTGGAAGANALLQPCAPWSLALPVRQHLIELTDEKQADAGHGIDHGIGSGLAPTTGLSGLQVGRSFIVKSTRRGAA